MSGIETQLTFEASPRIVYKALADPRNIPKYAPGVLDAEVVSASPNGLAGTRVDLLTRDRAHLDAYITSEVERRFLAIQDARGVVNEWELKRAPDGRTLATHRLLGDFPEDRLPALAHEAREKVYAFRATVDAGFGDRTRNG